MAAAIETRPILEECRAAARLRGTPVRPTWWEQDLTLPPDPEEEDDDEPGTGGDGPPKEGRSASRALPRRQPRQSLSLAEQRAARRAEWEARNTEEEEVGRGSLTGGSDLAGGGEREGPSGGSHAGGVRLEDSRPVAALATNKSSVTLTLRAGLRPGSLTHQD